VNLLLVPYMLDAIRALEHGVASVGDIDTGMQLGAAMPTGPLALCDYVGLDTLERVASVLYEAYRERRYAPPPLLHRMVVSGWLGRKNGRGFYDYSVEPPVPMSIAGRRTAPVSSSGSIAAARAKGSRFGSRAARPTKPGPICVLASR